MDLMVRKFSNDYCAEAELMILKEEHEFINLRMGKGK
jgi:hypothetical protein